MAFCPGKEQALIHNQVFDCSGIFANSFLLYDISLHHQSYHSAITITGSEKNQFSINSKIILMATQVYKVFIIFVLHAPQPSEK